MNDKIQQVKEAHLMPLSIEQLERFAGDFEEMRTRAQGLEKLTGSVKSDWLGSICEESIVLTGEEGGTATLKRHVAHDGEDISYRYVVKDKWSNVVKEVYISGGEFLDLTP